MAVNEDIGQDYRRWIIHYSDPDLKTKAVALRENMWPRAIECANEHGVLLIIHDKLQKGGVLIPRGSLSAVRDHLLLQTLRIHLHKRFLIHLCREAQNLPDFMVIKGLALATQLYSDPYQRPLRDVDILIRRKDYPFWLSFLKGMGFIHDPSSSETKDGKVDFLNICQEPFEHTIRVELHCELFDYPKRHIWPKWLEQVWENREFISIDGEMIPVMGIPVLLPYLCAHQFLTAHGRFYRLIWLVDVLLLVRKHSQNIFDKEVLSVIKSNPALRLCVYNVLHYVQTMFEIPPEVADVTTELRPLRNLYGYVPLMRAEEFIDNNALLPSVKRKIFRDTFEGRWNRKLKRNLRLLLCYILEIFKRRFPKSIKV
jgi:hypothetical protein